MGYTSSSSLVESIAADNLRVRERRGRVAVIGVCGRGYAIDAKDWPDLRRRIDTVVNNLTERESMAMLQDCHKWMDAA
jgi:hypothetical protein